jgi:hypothetical protein
MDWPKRISGIHPWIDEGTEFYEQNRCKFCGCITLPHHAGCLWQDAVDDVNARPPSRAPAPITAVIRDGAIRTVLTKSCECDAAVRPGDRATLSLGSDGEVVVEYSGPLRRALVCTSCGVPWWWNPNLF